MISLCVLASVKTSSVQVSGAPSLTEIILLSASAKSLRWRTYTALFLGLFGFCACADVIYENCRLESLTQQLSQ